LKANLYELVIDIYKFVVDIHQKERDYGQLGESFRDLKVVCEALVKSVCLCTSTFVRSEH
jgi:hypothetical protein